MNINIMQREYDCPICGARFKAPRPRMAKLTTIGYDKDLRPYYEGIDIVNYEVVVCTSCGFTALHDSFLNFDSFYVERTKIGLKEVSVQKMYLTEIINQDAIDRYISAIMLLEYKKAPASEYYYLFSRLSWVYRTYDDDDALENEYLALKKAFMYLELAYKNETLPFFGMDESKVIYVLGDMARRIGEYEKANLYIGKAILDPNSTDELRERAKEIKGLISENSLDAVKIIEDAIRATSTTNETKTKTKTKKKVVKVKPKSKRVK